MQRMHLAVQGRLYDLLVLAVGGLLWGGDLFVGADQDRIGAAAGGDEAAATGLIPVACDSQDSQG